MPVFMPLSSVHAPRAVNAHGPSGTTQLYAGESKDLAFCHAGLDSSTKRPAAAEAICRGLDSRTKGPEAAEAICRAACHLARLRLASAHCKLRRAQSPPVQKPAGLSALPFALCECSAQV